MPLGPDERFKAVSSWINFGKHCLKEWMTLGQSIGQCLESHKHKVYVVLMYSLQANRKNEKSIFM